jgi:hypothetical protein
MDSTGQKEFKLLNTVHLDKTRSKSPSEAVFTKRKDSFRMPLSGISSQDDHVSQQILEECKVVLNFDKKRNTEVKPG